MKALPEDRSIIERAPNEVNGLGQAVSSFFSRKLLRTCTRLCLCAALALAACSDDEDKAQRLARQAEAAFQEQQVEEAVAVYRDLIDRFPQTEAARDAGERLTFLSGLQHSVQSFAPRTARDLMVETARAVQSYRWRTGRWPDSLDDLMPKMIKEAPIDPWGRPLQYEKRRNGYRLSCLGGDGRVGGDGDATDFVVINGNFVSDPANEGPF